MAVQESGAQAVGRPVPPTKAHWSMKSFAGPPFAKSSSMRALLAMSSRRGYLLSVILAFVNVYTVVETSYNSRILHDSQECLSENSRVLL